MLGSSLSVVVLLCHCVFYSDSNEHLFRLVEGSHITFGLGECLGIGAVSRHTLPLFMCRLGCACWYPAQLCWQLPLPAVLESDHNALAPFIRENSTGECPLRSIHPSLLPHCCVGGTLHVCLRVG